MIDASIKLTVAPEKRKELIQTFKALLGPIRCEQGCISCDCYVDIEAENVILFKEQWKTREDLDNHLRSVHYSVLIEAMKLFSQKPEFSFNTIVSTAGADAVKIARV
jgi:quinol monooxygenase YgiN